MESELGAGVGPVASVADEGELSTETIFETLSNQRRRYVLHYLKRLDEPVTVRALSEQVAAWENDCAREDVTPKERKRVYTALHQTHLPRMKKSGVVAYDSARSLVELTDGADAFDIYLEVTHGEEFNWADYYLGLGLVGAALGVAVAIAIYPFTLLPAAAYVLLLAIVLLASAVAHVVDTRRNRLGSTTEPPELLPPDSD